MIEKEEFKNKINGVVNHIKNNDIANATSELLSCIDDFNTGFDELTSERTKITGLEETNKSLQSNISALKDTNYELLLRVGTPNDSGTTNTPNINNSNLPGEQPKAPRKFEDLFNEKGELK